MLIHFLQADEVWFALAHKGEDALEAILGVMSLEPNIIGHDCYFLWQTICTEVGRVLKSLCFEGVDFVARLVIEGD